MAIAWFLSPYKLRPLAGWLPIRYCAVDDFTADIEADNGDWRESEIDGGLAVVRVRARVATLARIARGSDVGIRRIDDPLLHWTSHRTAPINRGGEIAFDSGESFASLPLDAIVRHVLDNAGYTAHMRAAEKLMRQADQEGYVRIPVGNWDETSRLLATLARAGYNLKRISSGTFPTTGILDNANRGDGGAGANWSNLLTALSITSNAFSTTGTSVSYWNPSTYGADSEAYITVSQYPAATGFESASTRLKDLGSVATFDGYTSIMTVVTGAGNDTVQIQRIDNGVATTLGSTITQEYSAGEGLGNECIGSTIAAYRNSGGWASLGSRTDSTYTAAGNIGLAITSTGRADDFGGGTVVPGSAAQPPRGYLQPMGIFG